MRRSLLRRPPQLKLFTRKLWLPLFDILPSDRLYPKLAFDLPGLYAWAVCHIFMTESVNECDTCSLPYHVHHTPFFIESVCFTRSLVFTIVD